MTENRIFDEFKAKFRVGELKVLETDSWTWSVRPAQPTLGAGILSLKRYALKLSEVTPAEMADLAVIVSTLEKTIKATFNHDIMNYLMLMMVDHHVHYHVIPRYDGVRAFAGRDWMDNGWPALPVLSDSQHPDEPDLLRNLQGTLITSLQR